MNQMSFHKSNSSGNLLQIETDGCTVNIRVGLSNMEGQEVTVIEILPDDHSVGGEKWKLDGTIRNRVIRQ